jgi:PAS domain S-box-containing protein
MRNLRNRGKPQLIDEIEQLRARLQEAEQTLEAIRSGDVDALVVAGPQGERVFSLTGAEHIYRVIAETMHEAALTVTPDGTVLFCNRRFCDLMKSPVNETIGRKITRFVSPPQEQPLEKILVDVQAGPLQRRLTFRASDGTPIPVLLSASVIVENSSRSICLVASDLTEVEESGNSIRVLREHQQALEASEHRLRAIFDSAEEAIITLDDDQRCLEANPATGVITGIPHAQLAGRFLGEFVDPHYDLPAAWAGFLKTGRFHGEVRVLHTSGEERILEASGVAHIGPGRHLFVGHDVTERKRMEEGLRSTHAKMNSLMERMSDAFVTFDRGWRYTYINPAAARILRMEPEELLGKNVWEIWPGAYDHPVGVTFRRSLEEDIPMRLETYYGEPLNGWFECRCYPMPDGLATFFSDITVRKRAEEALELRVRERTAELERKNRELQDFAFIASHDLSEPLRKIQTFGSLLHEKNAALLDHQSKDYISRMTGAANRMQDLLDALLRYSRIESRGQAFGPVKLHDVAKEAAGDLELSVQKIQARIEIGPLPVVTGDPDQLRQLFQNVFANALKYRRSEAGTSIRIYGEENHGAVRVFVEDNGIGFDEKYLDKIFQPFQRLHGKNEYSGTGIGLAICRKIVERHGGTITARSTPGKGSTFILTLPAKQP